MVTLYIATSLDGFIADENGGIDWLENPEMHEEGEDYGYSEFIKGIDVTFMGRKTYDQVQGFGEWHYSEKDNFIFTSRPGINAEHGKAVTSLEEVMDEIKRKNCWLIGGESLNSEFLKMDLIDLIILTTMPVFLGKGIPLFTETMDPSKFSSQKHLMYPKGVAQYYLQRRNR